MGLYDHLIAGNEEHIGLSFGSEHKRRKRAALGGLLLLSTTLPGPLQKPSPGRCIPCNRQTHACGPCM